MQGLYWPPGLSTSGPWLRNWLLSTALNRWALYSVAISTLSLLPREQMQHALSNIWQLDA